MARYSNPASDLKQRTLIPTSSSGFEETIDKCRAFASLLKSDPCSYIDEKSYKKLVETFEDSPSKKAIKEDICQRLLNEASRQASWSGALKSLMTIHKLVHKLGGQGVDVTDFVNSKKIKNFTKFKTAETGTVDLLHIPHISYYYSYLQRLSYNYEDLKVCFFPDAKIPTSFKNGDLPILHFLTRVQNILTYLIKLLPLFEVSFVKFSKVIIIRQLAYFYLTDCFRFYAYLNQVIQSVQNEFFNLPPNEAIALYEVYIEHIEITKKLEENAEIIKYLEEFAIKTPEFYKIDSEFDHQIHIHISTMKYSMENAKKAPISSFKHLQSLPTYNKSHSIPEPKFSSLVEIKNVLSIVTDAKRNFVRDLDSSLFSPPNPAKKKLEGPLSPPAIKVLRPKNQKPKINLEILSARNNDPNPNLLKVPQTSSPKRLPYGAILTQPCFSSRDKVVGSGSSSDREARINTYLFNNEVASRLDDNSVSWDNVQV